MPTGYTAPVMDGEITELKDFAATCARAFGCFMHQRDDSKPGLRYPSPPSDYYSEALVNAKDALAHWQSLNVAERRAEYDDYVRSTKIAQAKSRAESAEKRARYESMLLQVISQDVPERLANFKNFMIEQLQQSIEFDCGDGRVENDYYRVLSFDEWVANTTKRRDRDVEYYHNNLVAENRRYREQIEYINLMVETFGFEVEGYDGS